ncbi:hypothetical protein JCM10212_005698 [Sporobolomyces blumeae]
MSPFSTSSLTAPLLLPSEPPAAPARLAALQEHPPASPAALALSNSNKNRPRAGTLPSTFHLNPPGSSLSRSSLAVDSLLAPPPLHNGAASLPGSGSTTPQDLPFPSGLLPSSASSPSRLRSGSLTALPPTSSNLSSAFGPGTNVFSSGDWAPRPSRAVGTPTSKMVDDVRSPEGSAYGDEHVRTLDYLGLDDEPTVGRGSGGGGGGGTGSVNGLGSVFGSVGEGSTGVAGSNGAGLGGRGEAGPFETVAPSMHRLGSTGSMRLPQNPLMDAAAHHARLRSNTVATFPRSVPSPADALLRSYHQNPAATSTSSYPSSLIGVPLSSPSPRGLPDDDASSYHRSNSSTDSGRLLYATSVNVSDRDPSPPPSSQHASAPLVSIRAPHQLDGLDSPAAHRARAATIGILDDSREPAPRRRAGTTIGVGVSPLGLTGATSVSNGLASSYPTAASTASVSRALGNFSIGEDGSGSIVPTPYAIPHSSRPRTPEQVSMSPPHQQPTRSLWVGNLDPKTTTADLQQVFAPYGAIESLRLIPDKECGFVNFVSVADAIRAKEDVLNRLGGQLTKTSGLVRIGYGKAEATPAPAAPGLVHPRSTAAGAAVLSGADLNLQTQPTRALWVGSIPSSTTPNHLLAVFSSFGPIESARVLTHKSCGFVNFERLDDAVAARKSLNGREILGAEVGPVRIGFAKVPSKIVAGGPHDGSLNGPGSHAALYDAVSQLDGVSGIPVDRQIADGDMQDYRSGLVVGLVSNGHYASANAISSASNLFAPGAILPPAPGEPQIETVAGSINEQQLLMRELSQGDADLEEHVKAVAGTRPPKTYYNSIPLNVLNDNRFARRYTVADAPRLREIRKKLDGALPQGEVDTLSRELLDEVVPLASDYIGNTIVQKLFERCSRSARLAMLERIAPHLAPIGTHKNGTWAVQKIIQCAQDDEEYAIIEQNLQPYTPPLLLNEFGNYVVQGTLRFGPPHSTFLFDGMVDRIWEIGSGRFGARSTRQTLENPESPLLQIKRVVIAIILNAIPLATSSNGTLLLTWLLETSEFPNRYSLVAPRFATHLSHLLTHKLASQSVLRIISQDVDLEAQRMILDALFDAEGKVLEDILGDQVHGTASISKVMASTFLSDSRRQNSVARIKSAIDTLNVQSVPAYKKLMDEVGLAYHGPAFPAGASPQSGSPTNERRSPGIHRRPSPRTTRNQNGAPPPHPHQFQQHNFAVPPPPPPPPFAFQPYPMQYPPPNFGGPPHPAYPYANSSDLYPFAGPPTSSFNGRNGNGTAHGLSPIMTHPTPPGGGGGASAPFSPPPYPFSPGGDPYSTMRLNTGEHVGFNPQFSPVSSPQPSFYHQSFAQQQQNGRPRS